MKKIFILFFCTMLSTYMAQAQEKSHPFVNMTELGGLFGRVNIPTYSYYYPPHSSSWYPYPAVQSYRVKNVSSISAQTFNGVYLNPKTAVGVTLGADWYNSALITPLAAGVRQVIARKKAGGSSLMASLDAGWGAAWFHEDNPGQKTTGGLMLNPAVGLRFPMRSGSSLLLNFGYKYQGAETKELISPENHYNISGLETKNFNRVQVRLGFEW